MTNTVSGRSECDVLVVGAGFAGMYLLHKLRPLGFKVKVIEAGADVGGTWFWNRYPGARVDIQSLEYSMSFDSQLERDWTWTEKYAPQPELLKYARHIAERYDLRKDIAFETRAQSATWDEQTERWTIGTSRGETISARFYVMARGHGTPSPNSREPRWSRSENGKTIGRPVAPAARLSAVAWAGRRRCPPACLRRVRNRIDTAAWCRQSESRLPAAACAVRWDRH